MSAAARRFAILNISNIRVSFLFRQKAETYFAFVNSKYAKQFDCAVLKNMLEKSKKVLKRPSDDDARRFEWRRRMGAHLSFFYSSSECESSPTTTSASRLCVECSKCPNRMAHRSCPPAKRATFMGRRDSFCVNRLRARSFENESAQNFQTCDFVYILRRTRTRRDEVQFFWF